MGTVSGGPARSTDMTPTWTPARNSCRSCSLMAKDMGEGCHVAGLFASGDERAGLAGLAGLAGTNRTVEQHLAPRARRAPARRVRAQAFPRKRVEARLTRATSRCRS